MIIVIDIDNDDEYNDTHVFANTLKHAFSLAKEYEESSIFIHWWHKEVAIVQYDPNMEEEDADDYDFMLEGVGFIFHKGVFRKMELFIDFNTIETKLMGFE